MAKELPYFKFEPNEWENGNIQILDRETKGLFIDLCSMYWSRLGNLPFKLAIQKLCGGNATALDSLCEEKIIEVIDGDIYIKFLSIQLNEFGDVSKQNSENAKLGWEKRRKNNLKPNIEPIISEVNATALRTQSESDAIREDKSIENKIKETINYDRIFNSFKSITNKNIKIFGDKEKAQLRARLKDGFTYEDIELAIKNCYNDLHHKETGHKYLTLEFILRQDKLNKFSSSIDKEVLYGLELSKAIIWSKPEDITREQYDSLPSMSKQSYSQLTVQGKCKIL